MLLFCCFLFYFCNSLSKFFWHYVPHHRNQEKISTLLHNALDVCYSCHSTNSQQTLRQSWHLTVLCCTNKNLNTVKGVCSLQELQLKYISWNNRSGRSSQRAAVTSALELKDNHTHKCCITRWQYIIATLSLAIITSYIKQESKTGSLKIVYCSVRPCELWWGCCQ